MPENRLRGQVCGIGKTVRYLARNMPPGVCCMHSVLEPLLEDVVPPRLSKLRMASTNERRRWPRANVHLQVTFFCGDEERLACTTRDISSGGFYVLSERPCWLGERMDCVLYIPAHESRRGEERIQVQCRVEVVRVDNTVDGRFGTAYRILDYQVRGRHVSE